MKTKRPRLKTNWVRGEKFTDHLGRDGQIVHRVLNHVSRKLKPLRARVDGADRDSFYHYNQLTPVS